MRKINEIIIHCAATPPNWMTGEGVAAQAAEIARWHKDRGWRDIGYHFVIGRDGKWVQGRPVDQVGAHVRGHNANSIGICLIGGKDSKETDKFQKHFTPAQNKALRQMLDTLSNRFPTITKITGHNDYTNAKACPGFSVPEWLKEPEWTPSKPAKPGVFGWILELIGRLVTRNMK